MNFLADESCAGSVIRALRDAGHDVIAIAEDTPRVSDAEIDTRSLRERRIVVTEDRDFGELVYARGLMSSDVVFVKFPSSARRSKTASVVEAIGKLQLGLQGGFAVIEPGRVRLGRRQA